MLRLGEHESIEFYRSALPVLSCPVCTSKFASAELLVEMVDASTQVVS